MLKNLDMDTEYTVTVVPVYSAGEGQPMSENGKTCKFSKSIATWEIRESLSNADLEHLQEQTGVEVFFCDYLQEKKDLLT